MAAAGNIMSTSPTKTLIVVILDESGSMQIQKRDVIGGYNGFIETQRNVENDQGRLLLLKFNSKTSVAHAATPMADAPLLNADNFQPGGPTALYDAVADGIRFGEAAVESDERVLVLIMTDGEENCSKKATAEQVKNSIAAKENLGNWTFAYIGENPDGWTMTMGQSHRTNPNASPYNIHEQGANFAVASVATRSFRTSVRGGGTTEGFFSVEGPSRK